MTAQLTKKIDRLLVTKRQIWLNKNLLSAKKGYKKLNIKFDEDTTSISFDLKSNTENIKPFI